MAGLSDDNRETFCIAYLVTFNATEAYKEVNPSVKRTTAAVEGSKLLRDSKIGARIDELRDERNKRLNIRADDLLTKLRDLAFYDVNSFMGEYLDGAVAGAGVARKPLNEVPRGILAGAENDIKGERILVKYKFSDRIRAIELLGKSMGLFADKLSLEIAEPVQIRVNGETKAILGVTGNGSKSPDNGSNGRLTSTPG